MGQTREEHIAGYLSWQSELGGTEVVMPPGFKPAPVPNRAAPAGSRHSHQAKESDPSLSLSAQLQSRIGAGPLPDFPKPSDKSAAKSSGTMSSRGKNRFPAVPEVSSMEQLYDFIYSCGAYPASPESGNSGAQIILPTGKPSARLTLVTVTPLFPDDAAGMLLQGKSGEQLDKMLKYINIDRADVYCTCIIKHPFREKKADWFEKDFHRQIIEREISLTASSVVVLMGRNCCEILLKKGGSLESLRKTMHQFPKNDILKEKTVIATYHPGQLILNQKLKKPAAEDLKWIQQLLQNGPKA